MTRSVPESSHICSKNSYYISLASRLKKIQNTPKGNQKSLIRVQVPYYNYQNSNLHKYHPQPKCLSYWVLWTHVTLHTICKASFKSARESLQAVKEDRLRVHMYSLQTRGRTWSWALAAGDELARSQDAGPLRPAGDCWSSWEMDFERTAWHFASECYWGWCILNSLRVDAGST